MGLAPGRPGKLNPSGRGSAFIRRPGCTCPISSCSERDLPPRWPQGVRLLPQGCPQQTCLWLLSGLTLGANRSSSPRGGNSPWNPGDNEPSGLARRAMSGGEHPLIVLLGSWDSECPEPEGTLILLLPSTAKDTKASAKILDECRTAHRPSAPRQVPGFIFLSLSSKAQNNTEAGLQAGSRGSPKHLTRRHRPSPAQQSQYAALTGTSITGLRRAGAGILKGTVSEAGACRWPCFLGGGTGSREARQKPPEIARIHTSAQSRTRNHGTWMWRNRPLNQRGRGWVVVCLGPFPGDGRDK